MTSPDQPGEQPYRPGGGSGEPPPAGDRPAEPVPRSWDWAIDPPPPEGPTREPTPDPAAGSSVDEIPDPIPLTGRFPDTVAPGAGPPSPPRPEGPPPPDWSTPETRVSTPPLSGYPPPQPPQPPIWASQPAAPEAGTGPEAGRPPPGGPARTPEFVRQTDRRWWFVLGLVAAVLSCCCVAAAVIALAWGPDFYTGLRDPAPRIVGLNQPARDGDLEFQVHSVRCGFTEVGDPLVSQLAVGQFCLVDLAVRNLGARPVTFQDSLQIAYGPAGQRFGVDTSAGLLANADQVSFLSEINPGNRVTGAVVYDIPPDARIVRLRLRTAATSPGIQVRTG
ncbi:hypothetical protein C6361_18420 [Plantactinospora sp. BC1]|uniref:DUF4352 domain-containing protein n=1 Tax=Plantactinospora sp. BC1 TaxID=2108470 RepID=UPI000D159F44|nr:DUF4352 domain-containing protein [Plantactinospora sp. BC1]AVT31118.1 hypothetical protein C6361_18420 [Plantactinospora sp. BC1]